MRNVSEDEAETFLDRLYAASVEPDGWNHVMRALMDLFHAHMSHVVMHDAITGRIEAAHCHGYDVALFEKLGPHYQPADPLRQRVSGLLGGGGLHRRTPPMAIHGARMLPDAELKETEYYRDFGRFTGFDDSLFIGGSTEGSQSCWLVVNSGVGRRFADDEVDLARLMSQHVLRAFRLQQQVSFPMVAGSFGRLWQDSQVALILVSGGSVRYENTAATEILSAGNPLRQSHGSLQFRDTVIQDAYEKLLKKRRGFDAAHGHSMAFHAQGEGTARWLVQLVSLRPTEEAFRTSFNTQEPGVLVAVTPLTATAAARENAIHGLLQLTDAEREVLQLLVQGLPVGAIAASTGRSVATVRWHIRSLIEKFQANSVADVIRIGALLLPM